MLEKKCKIIFFLPILILTLLVSCTKLSKEDEVARQDDNSQINGEQNEEIDLFPDTQLGKKLDHHMRVLTLPTERIEEADQLYNESIIELRKNPNDVVNLLKEAYTKIEENRYFDRWGLVKTMADLKVNESFPVLQSILRSKIPEEKLADLHHFSTQEEEQIIRLQAVEGLTFLASQNNKEAEQELLRIVLMPDYPYYAIKKRAIKGYLKAGKDLNTRIRFLKSKLPEELYGIITLEVTPIEVFQERVKDLATITSEQTNEDQTEEQLEEEGSPVIKTINEEKLK